MKKLLKYIFAGALLAGLLLGSSANAATLQGWQGGTGFGTSSAANDGNCLTQSSSTPFLTWTIGACGGTFTTSTLAGLTDTSWLLSSANNLLAITTSTPPSTITFTATTTPTFTTVNGVNPSTWLTAVVADSPLSGSGTSASHLIFTNPGYITATGQYWTLSGTNLYPTSTSYSVGIGTTTPATALSVVGSISQSAVTSSLLAADATGKLVATSSLSGGTSTSTFTLSLKNVTSSQIDAVGIFEASSTIKKFILTMSGGGTTLNSGLQHYYKLEDNTDSTSTLTLINNNVVTFGPGKVNNAAYFGANNTNKDLATSTNPWALPGAFTGSWTMNAWVNVTSTPSSGNFMVAQSWAESASSTGADIWYQNTGGTMQLKCNRARQNVADDGTLFNYTLTPGTWFMVTCTYDGTNIRSYVNGILQDTTAASGDGNTGIDRTIIGAYHGGAGQFWSGEVDEAGFWNRALNQTLINNLYNNGAGRTMPFLQTNVSIGLGYTTSTISSPMSTSTLFNLLSSTNNIIDTSVMNCFALTTSTACSNPIDASSTPSGLDSLYFWNNGLSTTANALLTVFYTEP